MQRHILNVLKPYAVMVIYFFFPINVLLVSFHKTPYCISINEAVTFSKPFIWTTLLIRISLKLFHIQDTL